MSDAAREEAPPEEQGRRAGGAAIDDDVAAGAGDGAVAGAGDGAVAGAGDGAVGAREESDATGQSGQASGGGGASGEAGKDSDEEAKEASEEGDAGDSDEEAKGASDEGASEAGNHADEEAKGASEAGNHADEEAKGASEEGASDEGKSEAGNHADEEAKGASEAGNDSDEEAKGASDEGDDGESDEGSSEEGDAGASGKAGKRGKWLRRTLYALVGTVVLLVGMRIAVHEIPGFGPWVANTLRSMFGNEFVAWLEDTVYETEDWVNRQTKADDPPTAMWEVPEVPPSSIPAPSASTGAGKPPPPPFELPKLPPMHENVVTKGDGVWVPVVDPRFPKDRTRLLKTFVHPDKTRSWAVVAVVAVDLSSVDLHAVPGRHEPERKTKEAKAYDKRAVVPERDREALIAAFNGGYKSTHGDYGMMVDGVVFQPPRALCCVVARLRDGSYLIRDWDKVKERRDEMVWWRQTPICMFDEGEPHPALAMKKLGWGAATVSGTTVIRRSAIGLNEDRTVLYVGIGDAVTGHAIGTAMNHAGAHYVSQLDVNFSFPKFVLYKYKEPGSKELEAVALTENFEYEKDQYIGRQSGRDFFYLARKPDDDEPDDDEPGGDEPDDDEPGGEDPND
jgi:hypothetical protein